MKTYTFPGCFALGIFDHLMYHIEVFAIVALAVDICPLNSEAGLLQYKIS